MLTWFTSIKQAQMGHRRLWLKQYNYIRPHQALNMRRCLRLCQEVVHPERRILLEHRGYLLFWKWSTAR